MTVDGSTLKYPVACYGDHLTDSLKRIFICWPLNFSQFPVVLPRGIGKNQLYSDKDLYFNQFIPRPHSFPDHYTQKLFSVESRVFEDLVHDAEETLLLPGLQVGGVFFLVKDIDADLRQGFE